MENRPLKSAYPSLFLLSRDIIQQIRNEDGTGSRKHEKMKFPWHSGELERHQARWKVWELKTPGKKKGSRRYGKALAERSRLKKEKKE